MWIIEQLKIVHSEKLFINPLSEVFNNALNEEERIKESVKANDSNDAPQGKTLYQKTK